MKNFASLIVALLLFALCPAVLGAEPTGDSSPVGDKWALVVGISRFKDPSINLQYAAKDATDFAQYLIKEAGFAPDHVKVLTNEEATQKRIMSELGSKWLPRVAAPEDLVVVFVSSHGSPSEMDVQGVNYIVAHDSDPEDLYTTAIEMQDLIGTISRRVHSKRVVVFLDSCHSGGATATTTGAKGIKRTSNFDLSKVPIGHGQYLISSSQQDQVSWELKSQPNGAFTYCLLEVLRRNQDATIPEVFRILKDNVQRTVLKERGALQTPVERSSWSGPAISLTVPPTTPQTAVALTQTAATSARVDVGMTQTTVASSQPAATTAPSQVVPEGIAVLPASADRMTANIRQIPPNMKVLWGVVRDRSELTSLPAKFDERVFRDLRSKFGNKVLGPLFVRETLEQNKFALNTPDDWRRLAQALQARYLISSTIDEASWDTSVMSNKYGLVVSSTLISGETGLPISEVKSLRVKKAPFQGDIGGGRKYFENTVAPEAANEVAKILSKRLAESRTR